jgi:hypothetical protein
MNPSIQVCGECTRQDIAGEFVRQQYIQGINPPGMRTAGQNGSVAPVNV